MAFEKYADQCLTSGQLKIYMRDKAKFSNQAKDLVNILFEKQNIDKKNRQVKTMIKVSMKTNMLQALFADNSPAAKSGSGALMVYIFAGRQAVQTVEGSEVAGPQRFLTKKLKRFRVVKLQRLPQKCPLNKVIL